MLFPHRKFRERNGTYIMYMFCVVFIVKSVEKMRDFLVSKLKEAEVAIKSSMDEKEILKRQANTDHEVSEVHYDNRRCVLFLSGHLFP